MPRPSVDTTVPRDSDEPQEEVPPARLWVVFPAELVGPLPIGPDPATVGRAPDGLQVDHGTVSRQHLGITWDPAIKRHVVEDLASRNGTAIDGVRLAGARRALDDGAVVRLGEVVAVYERGAGLLVDDADEVSRDAIPGESAAARTLRAAVGRAGPDAAHALLVGETGTGKEQVARELHRLRRRGPFVAVNCAELSGELMESRLFGHARGAFTGAQQAEPGLFRSADGGTLLLDEIGELPPPLQPKLLRALQEREVLPVGENRPVRADVRVIGASNRDLAELMERGAFRRDLHARLAFWEIATPPLRARRADLLGWITRLHGRHVAQRPAVPGEPLRFTADAVEALLLAAWPDNLRGLDRVVHRLAVQRRTGDVIRRADVEPLIAPRASPPAERPAAPASREELEAVLERHGGSVHALSRFYGRERTQIYRWLKAYGLR